jgi:hypothetical protein
MKKLILTLTCFLLLHVAFGQSKLSWLDVNDIYSLKSTAVEFHHPIKIGSFYLNGNTDSVWLEKPLGTFLTRIDTVKAGAKIDTSLLVTVWAAKTSGKASVHYNNITNVPSFIKTSDFDTSNLAHKSRAETFTGAKTFTGVTKFGTSTNYVNITADGLLNLYQSSSQTFGINSKGFINMYNSLGNVGIGYSCLSSTGYNYNTAIGYYSQTNNAGSANTSVGYYSLSNISDGGNTAVGYQSGYNARYCSGLVAIGYQAAYTGTANSYAVAIGHQSLYSAIVGSGNVSIGGYCCYKTTGGYNVGIGQECLYNNTGGMYNIALGYLAGYYNTTLSNRLFINSISRSNLAGDTTKSIIYGFQHNDVSSQRLYFNAGNVYCAGNLTNSGSNTATSYFVSSIKAAPSSSTATGTAGEMRPCADGIYICIATNSWIKCTGTTF